MNMNFLLAGILSLMFFAPGAAASASDQGTDRVQARMVTDEADAVLAILSKRQDGAAIAECDWQKLFDSEGYRRLKKREASMQRAFTDDDFRKFVLSPELLASAPRLRETLRNWKEADISHPASLALAYLPDSATIRASVYPAIKPLKNSFVFEVDTDPAIFLHLDPEISREDFENTLAHELHHIGYGTACPPKDVEADAAKQPMPVQKVRTWVGAFGEGFAMLAAAGGPDVHPRATTDKEKRERWDLDMGQFYQNRLELDGFFMKVLKGELSGDQVDKQGFTYLGYQGPWYTVGYRMDVVVEKAFGRQRLINAMCDGSILAAYNEAIRRQANPTRQPTGKPFWSPEIIKALQVGKAEK